MALIYPPFVIHKGQEQTFEVKQLVASGTTASIDRGTFTKKNSTNVAVTATGDGTTSQLMTGIAKNASNETSTAAGSVETFFPAAGLIYRGNDKTATNSNTQALIDALIHKRVKLDLTGTTWTIDSSQADSASNCLCIVGGDPNISQLDFIWTVSGSYIGNVTT